MSYESVLSVACEDKRHTDCDPLEVVVGEGGYCTCTCHNQGGES